MRLGHISEEAFLDNLKKACTKYLSKQGVISLHKAGENKSAHFDLVYEGGKLVATVLDLQIRELTNNQKCLDDLMRRMYQRFGSTDQGYTQDDILAILKDLTGRDYRDFLADYINGTARLPLEEAFDQAGLKLEVTVEEELINEHGNIESLWQTMSQPMDRAIAIERVDVLGAEPYQRADS